MVDSPFDALLMRSVAFNFSGVALCAAIVTMPVQTKRDCNANCLAQRRHAQFCKGELTLSSPPTRNALLMASGQVFGTASSPIVEKHDARFFVRHVLVNGDNVDLVLKQRFQDRLAIHLPSPRSRHQQRRCRRSQRTLPMYLRPCPCRSLRRALLQVCRT